MTTISGGPETIRRVVQRNFVQSWGNIGEFHIRECPRTETNGARCNEHCLEARAVLIHFGGFDEEHLKKIHELSHLNPAA
ncbi:MAG: hypothetical protein KW806_03370 [Candidatus Yanofskybacteria bacterium]|nr:hypothetical protein [Candidatus Yanofskybacteria bacterium]